MFKKLYEDFTCETTLVCVVLSALGLILCCYGFMTAGTALMYVALFIHVALAVECIYSYVEAWKRRKCLEEKEES